MVAVIFALLAVLAGGTLFAWGVGAGIAWAVVAGVLLMTAGTLLGLQGEYGGARHV